MTSAVTNASKQCVTCGVDKPLIEFYRNKANPDGYQYACKSCERARARKWHQDNTKRTRDHDRQYASSYRGRTFRRKWKLANKEKTTAHAAVTRALENGTLIRPDRCERCNSGGKVIGHHSDYTKPLDVEWLCVKCHGAEHRKD